MNTCRRKYSGEMARLSARRRVSVLLALVEGEGGIPSAVRCVASTGLVAQKHGQHWGRDSVHTREEDGTRRIEAEENTRKVLGVCRNKVTRKGLSVRWD